MGLREGESRAQVRHVGDKMNDYKSAGWYYVGDGKLRYRDDYDWTEFYMDTSDPRTRDWPPPAPRTLLQELREEDRVWSAHPRSWRGQRLSTFFYRGRHAR